MIKIKILQVVIRQEILNEEKALRVKEKKKVLRVN